MSRGEKGKCRKAVKRGGWGAVSARKKEKGKDKERGKEKDAKLINIQQVPPLWPPDCYSIFD